MGADGGVMLTLEVVMVVQRWSGNVGAARVVELVDAVEVMQAVDVVALWSWRRSMAW